MVEAKRGARWETSTPLPRRADAEIVLAELATEPDVSFIRLLEKQQGEDGKPAYRVLRVHQPRSPKLAGEVGEMPLGAAAALSVAPAGAELAATPASAGVTVEVVNHGIVYYQPGEFSAWRANNGGQAWHWGDDILVAFFNGVYEEKEGHNWTEPTRTLTARSTDGGETWVTARFDSTVADPPAGEIDFSHPDFALRVDAGSEAFRVSFDRGVSWPGPYSFGDLLEDSPVAGDEFTARTDYLVNSADEILLFLSSKRPILFTEDYAYVARSSDGGASFQFVGFIDPFDLERNVMPSTVRTGDGELITCTRREDDDSHWVECYRSRDGGRSWSSLGRVDSTGDNNGNPPALVRLANGYLACVYGVRLSIGSRMSVKVSADHGRSWSTEHRLRTDFVGPDAFGDTDLGYPRSFVRPDGQVVAVYYWATASRPEQHIASTIFRVVPPPPVAIGEWRRGLTHPPVAGIDRVLLLTLHYVERGPNKEPRVRYGGQTMSKLLEREQEEGGKRTYVAVLYLKEDDLRKATGDRFEITWQPSPPDNWQAASAFLTHVDQVDAFGAQDTGAATSGSQIACRRFDSIPAGDAVIVAATARRRGEFTIAEFEVDDFSLSRGGVRDDGSGAVGHRVVPETAHQQAVVSHGGPGTLVVACVQVRQNAVATVA